MQHHNIIFYADVDVKISSTTLYTQHNYTYISKRELKH